MPSPLEPITVFFADLRAAAGVDGDAVTLGDVDGVADDAIAAVHDTHRFGVARELILLHEVAAAEQQDARPLAAGDDVLLDDGAGRVGADLNARAVVENGALRDLGEVRVVQVDGLIRGKLDAHAGDDVLLRVGADTDALVE
ncbi:MAG: hypothetical protein ABIR79_11400 [Candidatus Binatia bacterium]